jgi:hypothetical protein
MFYLTLPFYYGVSSSDGRGYQITDGEVILSPSKADTPLPNAKKSDMPVDLVEVISSLRCVAPVVQAKGTWKHLPFRRSSLVPLQVAVRSLR